MIPYKDLLFVQTPHIAPSRSETVFKLEGQSEGFGRKVSVSDDPPPGVALEHMVR